MAGIDLDNGEWVRHVSSDMRAHEALSWQDITYKDKNICAPLDVVLVDIVEATPLALQPENHLIDSSKYWKKTGKCTLSDVLNVHPAEIRPFPQI